MEECEEIELTKKCRACLCDENGETVMHCLFNEFDQGYTLGDLLTETMNSEDFKLEENDGLPMNLCDNCTGTVVNFFNMKIRFEENQRYLKELLESTNQIVNLENNLDNVIEECEVITENNSEQSNQGHEELAVRCTDINFEAEHTKMKEDNIKEPPSLGGDNQNYAESKLSTINITKATLSDILYQAACRDSLIDGDDSSFELREFHKYTCPYCAKCFFDVKFFQKHMTQVHGNEILLPEKYSTTIKMQVRKSDETVFYTCFKCKNTFSNDEDLKNHLNTHKKFICEKCGLGFSKRSYLVDHEQIHVPWKMFECQFCGKGFQRRTVLVKHKRIHTNPRQVICDVCGKAFNDRAALKTHIKLLHLGDRNFKCTICSQNFSLKSTLQKHMLRHSEDRKRIYSCDVCSISYKDKSSLNRHNASKHSGKQHKFTCEECGKNFVEKSSLNRHMNNCHCKALVSENCETVNSNIEELLVK